MALLVAAIILLAMWERYSKAWEFAADEHGGNANEETELMRPRTPRRAADEEAPQVDRIVAEAVRQAKADIPAQHRPQHQQPNRRRGASKDEDEIYQM